MPVLDLPVTDGLDDGTWREGNSSIRAGDANIAFGWISASGLGPSNCWFRFQNVTLPAGATITAAYLTLQAARSDSGTAVNVLINGVDEDNPAQPSSYNDVENRPRTTASVAWNNVEAFTLGTDYQTPDISSVIQEIIDRAGWASGNALMVYIEDNGSTQSGSAVRVIETFEGAVGAGPVLHLEWTESPAGPPIAALAAHYRRLRGI